MTAPAPTHSTPLTGQVHVRNAEVRDAAAIITLCRELAIFEKLEHEFVMTEEMVTREILDGSNPSGGSTTAIVAEVDGQVVGLAIYFLNFSTFLGKHGIYLEDLSVLPEMRSKGVGKALLVELAKRAVEKGFGRLEWSNAVYDLSHRVVPGDQVLDWNKRAISFYENHIGASHNDGWLPYRVTGEALLNLSRM